MGYESTFIVAEKAMSFHPDWDPAQPALVVATFDASKLGYESHTMRYVFERQAAQGDEMRYYCYSPLRGQAYIPDVVNVLVDEHSIEALRMVAVADVPKKYMTTYDIRVLEDMYGKPLTELGHLPLIEALRLDEQGSGYRRYAPLIALLEAFDVERWTKNLVVLHYGH